MDKIFIEVNGMNQGIYVAKAVGNKPAVLFLHGGPGSPETPLFERFCLVKKMQECCHMYYHEQRGAGITGAKGANAQNMTLEQFVEDIKEVARFIVHSHGEQIYLMGHSWGTMLGMHVIKKYPEYFVGYIGIGQVGDQLASEKETYQFMIDEAIKSDNQQLLKALAGENQDIAYFSSNKYLKLRAKYVDEYGGGLLHKEPFGSKEMANSYMKTKLYTLKEKLQIVNGMRVSQKYIISEVFERGTKDITHVDVPVFIMHGTHDYQTSYQQAKATYDALHAPYKHFFTFEDAAHGLLFEQPDKFMQTLEYIFAHKFNSVKIENV